MDFAFSDRARDMLQRAEDFMRERVYPAETTFAEQMAARPDAWDSPPVAHELACEARERGLWNLFLPRPEWGAGLYNPEYAAIAEGAGRSPYLAPGAVRCAALDTG